jgi:hypothetical protein
MMAAAGTMMPSLPSRFRREMLTIGGSGGAGLQGSDDR